MTRLVRHPAWLSRGCTVPCVGERTYEEWDTLRLGNNAAADPGSPPARIRCGGTSGRTNVVVRGGGEEVRNYFESY
jgi:hypothetical protein